METARAQTPRETTVMTLWQALRYGGPVVDFTAFGIFTPIVGVTVMQDYGRTFALQAPCQLVVTVSSAALLLVTAANAYTLWDYDDMMGFPPFTATGMFLYRLAPCVVAMACCMLSWATESPWLAVPITAAYAIFCARACWEARQWRCCLRRS